MESDAGYHERLGAVIVIALLIALLIAALVAVVFGPTMGILAGRALFPECPVPG